MQNEAKALADARTKYEELAAILASQKREWEKSVAKLAGFVADAKQALEVAEATLRVAAREYYDANPGTKKLPYGVGIRATSTLVYNETDAFAWAQEHKMALTLDKRAFEKIVKASPLNFVSVKEDVFVTLPTDTAKLLQD